MCGIWLCLRIEEGIQDGYQMIYTQLYFSIFSALLSKYVFFWKLKWHIDTHVSEMHTYFTFITCSLTRQHILFDFLCLCYTYIWRNKATFKCNIGGCYVQAVSPDFLLVGLPLLYLSRFEPHSDCLWESHVVLADGEMVLYGELPLLFHLTACLDKRVE